MINILRKVNIGARSAFCAVLALSSIMMISAESLAQTYPTKPIRIMVGNAPGASSDIIARIVAGKLTEALGQPLIIDNRPGASGRIGVEIAARAVPDGYTLLVMTSQHAIVTALYKNLNFDLVKDFSPISLVGTTPSLLVVNPSLPATSVKELVALAKSRSGALKYSSGGPGSSSHLPAAILKFMTGIDLLHVPYKSAPAALTGAMTGEVDMTFQPLTMCVPMVKSGKLRPLGVTSPKRTPLAPDFPSISETIPGYEFMLWQGLAAPAKTAPAILSKLNAEVIKALKTSAVREQMAAIGNEPRGSSQQDFALYVTDQVKRMREAVKISGAKPED